MADWYCDLYLGEKAREKEYWIRAKIDRGKAIPGVYLITYPTNEGNQLDIVESIYCLQKKVRLTLPKIVGIAIGYSEALELVQDMAYEAFLETGTCDLVTFLNTRI